MVGTALDPELEAIVKMMSQLNVPPPFSGTAEDARRRFEVAIMRARDGVELPQVGSAENGIAEYDNQKVPIRVYRPVGEQRILPTIIFFHGGGFVLGSVELMDDIARKLCRDVDAVVVSVDFRLAPENRFPAAHDDALTATNWALENASILGGDPSCVAVAGESAGANLAASTAISLSEKGITLAAQLLIVPGVDMARDIEDLEADGRHYPMLQPSDLKLITQFYLGSGCCRADIFPPSPLRAKDFVGLPPAVIAVAGHDPLYQEGLAYAERLVKAGVTVDLHCFEDMFHPFFGFYEASSSARRANDKICQAFSELLRKVIGPLVL
ncbi:alpha/beta hydrolase [Aestuariicella hydrocarbonica]|uniref:Alpha/beta hydrolase n=1 Tax=Pseudomaricurvus hydrocarbonicus TaxID=1470433 RepID=A0A9E5MHT5_9GAMM|nr:alpha/beta hydrolase [Aestuariicella hydrocarbonica]NHO66366.1 alpha/beta hydrolase [Aestuariicella hydrocarbonica]